MSTPFIDETGKDVSEVRPESLPGGADALRLLDAAVTALGGRRRDSKRFMAAKVAEALREHRGLLVQAGTGTGKSLAYLVPALVRARTSDKPVVVGPRPPWPCSRKSPAATSAPARRTGGRLDDRPGRGPAQGRSNYACLHKVEGGYPKDSSAALFSAPVATSGGVGTDRPLGGLAAGSPPARVGRDHRERGPDNIRPVSDTAWRRGLVTAEDAWGASARSWRSASRNVPRSAVADIVIADHALLAINAFEGLAVLQEHDVVIVDEAHELRDRVTSGHGVVVPTAAVRAASTAVRKHTAASSDALERAAQAFDKALRRRGLGSAAGDSARSRSTRCGDPGRRPHGTQRHQGRVQGRGRAARRAFAALGASGHLRAHAWGGPRTTSCGFRVWAGGARGGTWAPRRRACHAETCA
ncbi:hypothetical protein QJS66_06475 [Kocuria rhizophila]|nr:hypothetical protein QJS66_06475 [Kocuria rhizophila]